MTLEEMNAKYGKPVTVQTNELASRWATTEPKKNIIQRTVANVKEAVKDPLTVIPQRISESMGTNKPLINYDTGGKPISANREQAEKLSTFTTGFTGTGQVVDKTKSTVNALVENRQVGKLKNELLKVEEKITPKPTVKEAKLAQSQGRLVKGKDPTLLRGGTPDVVIPTDKTLRASETIVREIPNASKLKDPELYTALEGRTKQIAENLKPEMQKVSIKPETVEQITTKWENLKTKQASDPYLSRDVDITKLQEDFEFRLQNSKAGTMDDLWDTAKAYDDSVPSNVKSANELSSESLQNKKEIWLQNRAILRDAINDTENGMGEASRQPFKDMHDMYNAKESLQTKAKIETRTKASLVKQWIKKNPWIALPIGYKIGKEIEEATGLNIPVI